MKAKRWARYTIAAFAAWFIIHVAYTFINSRRHTERFNDVAVVFGNKVNEDGTLSPRLQARLDNALELYYKGKVEYIIVSGGLGKEGFYEGDKMKDYLVSKGFSANRIVVDNHGDNTLKTVENTKNICKTHGFKSVIVVSQWFHITRTKYMFRGSGLTISGSAPNYFEWRDFYSVTREFFAFYSYLL